MTDTGMNFAGGMGDGGAPSLGGQGEGAGGGGAGVGNVYIDDARIHNLVRFRFDALNNDNRPDRADFFYPKCGCFRFVPAGDPNAPGPGPAVTRNVDFQEATAYFELAGGDRFSGFAEIPYRWFNPSEGPNQSGLGDINFGFKYALIDADDRWLTLQVRTWTPSGDSFKGLGTDHWTLEPGLLFFGWLSERISLQAEARYYWATIDRRTDFTGNVFRYGAGVNVLAYQNCRFFVSPIAEVVGWSVLSGKELVVLQESPDVRVGGNAFVEKSHGEFILNAKFGLRFGFSNNDCNGLFRGSDLALSYGRALTGDVWYKDIFRIEYRLHF
jgi:hypothetical protein